MGGTFDYGEAIRFMELGHKVTRDGWNGPDMWVCLSNTDGPRTVTADKFWSKHTREFAEQNGGWAVVLPCLLMKNARAQIVQGWLASQEDMLAKDWRLA